MERKAGNGCEDTVGSDFQIFEPTSSLQKTAASRKNLTPDLHFFQKLLPYPNKNYKFFHLLILHFLGQPLGYQFDKAGGYWLLAVGS